MSKCSSFASRRELAILNRFEVVLVLDRVLVLAWNLDKLLPVEYFFLIWLFDSLLCFVAVKTGAIFFCLRSGESTAAYFWGLVLLCIGNNFLPSCTGNNFLGSGRLTGEDKDARELDSSCCLYFFVLLLVVLESVSSFRESLPLSFLLPGINHFGMIY